MKIKILTIPPIIEAVINLFAPSEGLVEFPDNVTDDEDADGRAVNGTGKAPSAPPADGVAPPAGGALPADGTASPPAGGAPSADGASPSAGGITLALGAPLPIDGTSPPGGITLALGAIPPVDGASPPGGITLALGASAGGTSLADGGSPLGCALPLL
ncbi:hypothetical protein RclHR1_05670012 [Rhizophagus clarus]|uniref:Uncharacterized protein n=1 Tax=Rhizophagus clarus TaxID=94130 RepID=A0A2Z6S5J5_9GLOM|nr:hypothetical protein RclHR1_05670012 [Rhizophagus clarus]